LTSKLGDTLSKDDKIQIFKQTKLLPGKIFLIDCEFTTAPKPKYLIHLGLFNEITPLFIVIGSKVPPFIQNNGDLRRCQIKILSSEYSFLDYDSFIDGSNVIDSIEIEDIVDQLSLNPSKDICSVNNDTKTKIRNVVKRATTITPIHKDFILDTLICNKGMSQVMVCYIGNT